MPQIKQRIDPDYNPLFYKEADRADSMTQINKSEGLFDLIARDIAYGKESLAIKYKQSLHVEIVREQGEYYIQIKEPND